MTTASNTGDPASQSQESATAPADVRGEAQPEAWKGTQPEAGGTVLEGIRGKVFLDRYARKGEDGTPLERYPEQMWRRVAAGIAAVEPTPEKQAEWTERFDGLLRDFKFVPGGRILSGAGTGHQVTYYNCFSGDTLVHTSEGIMRIGALRGTHDVLSQDGVYRPATFKSYGIQDLWDVVLENGTVIRATAGHEWVVKAPQGKRIRVTTRELAGRSIPVNPRPKPEIDENFHDGVRHGIIFGDGSTQYGKAHVDLFGEKMGLTTRFEDDYPTHVVRATIAVAEHARVSNLPTSYKALPSVDASPSYWRGFVVGLIATDGHVDNRGSVAIYSSNADQLHAISYGMAQAGFVPSSIRMTREFSPYSGERRPVYRLAIYRSSIVAEDIIKESHALNWAGAPVPTPALIKVESVRPLGQTEEVFCCEEPETHTFTVGHGYLTGNCYVVGLGENPLDPDAPRYPRLDPTEARPAFFNALGQMTDIMSRSGGVGINLSALPPKGTPIAAPGRAANAGATVRPTVALSLAHPDVARLLDEKDGPNLSHVDVAVIVPRAFDQALRDDEDWTPRWQDRAGETVRARDLWARVTSDEGRKVGILRPEAEVLGIDDSRDAIVSGAAEVATRLYQGQATVVDFSLLRPRGAYIKTVNGTSSGPVAWMYLFDAVARLDDGASPAEKGVIWFGEIASTITGKTIQQGGSRRGALMLMLDDDHPDVEEFIAAKRIGPDGRPVMIEHANMSLCVSDRFMEAVKADLPWDLVWQGRVVRTIRARDMWDRICTAAWTTAEPGVVFMERYQDRSNTYYFENIRCVNPCFPADARLYTGSGIYTFGELAARGSAVPVVAPDGSIKQATHVFQTGHKEVFRLTTNEGYTVRLTADHRVLTPAGLVEARDLAPGDEVLLLDAPGAFGPIGTARDGEELARRYAGDRDTDLRDLWRSTREMRAAFLSRVFEESETSRDGSLCHRAGGDYEAVRLIQQMLLTLGVRSAIGRADDAGALAIRPADRDALARAAGGLLVASEASVSASREAEPLGDGLGRARPFAATVARLTSEGYEDVYCLTEPDEALIVVDGIAATQCGEQGLPPGGVCNLGALNLERYVDDEGRLLEDDLARDAAYATRFLDDVIDATPYFSELHVQMQREGTRRTGLGTMGLADALIRMEVGYGSPASLETIDRIYRIVRDASYRESVELAREKGPFGRFDREEYLQGWFIGRLPADIQEGIREHGIRNGVLLTQAPTGTTSLLAGVSSGIEPVFDFAMKRVDRTGEHIMYHPLYQQWRDQHPGEERPAFFVGAKDLTPEEHIVVQAKVQEYTDSSISKTANVPNDFTVDNIKDLYMQAYDLGCKGVTCYRDGSRDAVLTSVTEKPKETAPVSAQTADDGAAGPATLPDLATVEAMLPVVETDIAAPLATPAPAVAPGTSAPAPARTPVAPAASATPVTTAAQASAAAMDKGAATPGGIAAPGMPTWVLDGRLKRRPNEMPGFTQNVTAPEGKVNITINSDADGPLELFINVGRAGTDIAALAEALGRLISLQLRLPSTMSQEERLRQVANQLRGIGGSRSIGFGKHRVLSLPDAVAQAIYRHLEEHPAPPLAHQPVVPVAQLALLDADDTPYSGSDAGSGYAGSGAESGSSGSGAESGSSGSGAESGGASPTLVAIPATMGSADPIIGATATPIASPTAAVASPPAAGGDLAAQATGSASSGVAAGNVAGLTHGKGNGGSNGNGHSLKAAEPAQTLVATATLTGNLCPQCGSSGAYVFEEGCKKCHYCGYSEC